MSDPPTLLFSSFEPSGDTLAAETIRALRRAKPQLRVFALGGPKMKSAGAELLEHTTQHGSMFLESLRQGWAHHKRLKRLRHWLQRNRIDAFVPVDSPAGNWSICRAVRRAQPQAKIVHLVAPQLWAWAPWRIRRLRRLTDHVLCLLPFEQQWLADRGVSSTFVGHPAFDPFEGPDAHDMKDLPQGRPRLALLPGSRAGEVMRNWPTMLEAFVELRRRHPEINGVVATLDDRSETLVREATPRASCEWPEALSLVTGRTDAVLDWCDMALVASGTVTLQVTARLKPMVVMYNMKRFTVFIGGWMVRTQTYTLPNLVSEWAGLGRAVPELVPHYGAVEPVVEAVEGVLTSDDAIRRQKSILAEVAARFSGHHFNEVAARELLVALDGHADAS